jgi:serine/threonine protein kinase
MRRPGEVEGLRVGDRFGPYEIQDVLGEGATGVVVRARGVNGAQVALKVLRGELARDDIYRRRFAHEVRAATEASNKHLVTILESGEFGGRPYLAMTYVAGPSLAHRLAEEGPLPLDDVTKVAAQVGSGLDALHRSGLIHRDVKPGNVLFDAEGSALLTDFGLAKGRAYTVLTRPGQAMGTLDYMAPELIRGESASEATDIYALGCVVYECIAGAPPFADRSVFEIGTAHLDEDPPNLSTLRTDLPSSLDWAVRRAVAKDPSERPPSATAYSHMLRAAAG